MKRLTGLRARKVAGVRIAALVPVVGVFLGARRLVMAIEDASWGAGAERARYAVLLLGATVALALVAESRYRLRSLRRPGLRFAALLVVCIAGLPVVLQQASVVGARFASPHLIDIPITTMAAARAMAAGQNPYTTPVDPRAESREQGKNYDGFKYMPLMAVAYAPAALARSERGVIAINACLHVVTAALVFLLARSLGGDLAAAFALLFYAWTRMLVRQLFGPGVTDLTAVAPLLAAFLAGGGYPFVSGLLVGASVSTKILPALALVPFFAPAANPLRDRRAARFWIGLACGCIPALVYFAWSPGDFLSNAIFFSLYRPVDSTSWLDGHPAAWRQISVTVLFLVLAGGMVFRWVRRPAPRGCALIVLAMTMAMTVLGPVNHGNYQLWWIPWMAAVLGFSACVYLYPLERPAETATLAANRHAP